MFNVDELQLKFLGDPTLTSPPPLFDFEKDSENAQELADVLYKKMLDFGGAGLSANQVGLPFRVFVIGNEEKYIALFNPFILGVSKEKIAMEEACLSIPGFSLVLSRPKQVIVNFYNEKGEEKTGTFSDISARIVLHELDHMEGRNFTQHASPMKFSMAMKRWKKKRNKTFMKQMQMANANTLTTKMVSNGN